jgi:hypothetical protein
MLAVLDRHRAEIAAVIGRDARPHIGRGGLNRLRLLLGDASGQQQNPAADCCSAVWPTASETLFSHVKELCGLAELSNLAGNHAAEPRAAWKLTIVNEAFRPGGIRLVTSVKKPLTS